MLKHRTNQARPPKRVVILGAKGFVGTASRKRLAKENIDILALGREDLDLSVKNAAAQLIKILRYDDSLLVISAKAPCKNHDLLLQNIQMMKIICDALRQQPTQQVIYISSDAVYTDSMGKLSEASPAAPTSLHGVMHLAREQMLLSVVAANALAILRPSLLYGAQDPHNGYGPNSFYRLASAGKAIVLFGQGEEQRDHVYIDDVAEIIFQCLLHRSYGVLNITTGDVVSFHEIAKHVVHLFDKPVEIQCTPRSMPMPHNGYRAFDNEVLQGVFPDIQLTSFTAGLKKMHQDYLQTRTGCVHERN
jgi:UDP-glucose 4-epimerase